MNEDKLLKRIKIIANKSRFNILKLTQGKELSITKLTKILKISYNKCNDYVRMLYRLNLIDKRKVGRKVLIKSKVLLNDNIIFN
ncbi:MAG: hypothetical protein ABIH51_00965 [Patescibacteria group bacterium]